MRRAVLAVAFTCLAGRARAEEPGAPSAPAAPTTQAAATAPIAIPAAGGEPCGRRWLEHVYPEVRRSVVRVRSVAGVGSGFVFGDDRHVATAYHVIALGRPLTIRFSDNQERVAHAVAVDPANDLALLELDAPAPAPARPLALAPTAEVPDVGAEVMVVGHPFSGIETPFRTDGVLDWSASRGIVSAKNAQLIQTDASSNPGNSGGPLVDCRGRALGVVSWGVGSGIAFAFRGELLARLWYAPRSVYMGRFGGVGAFSLLAHGGGPGAAHLGLSLGFGVSAYDRFDLMLRGAWLWGIGEPDGPVVVDTRRRIVASGEARVRFLLTRGGIYLALGAGGAYHHDLHTFRRFEARTATCAAPPCPSELFAQKVRSSEHYVKPLATVALVRGRAIELGYTLMLDPSAFGDSIHQFALNIVGN